MILHLNPQVGLLPRDNTEQVSFAYKLYTRTDKTGIALAAGFKKTFSQDVNIEFLGVWFVDPLLSTRYPHPDIDTLQMRNRDTVASVGVVMNRTLPFVSSNTAIKTFRHAVSLDEVSCRIFSSMCCTLLPLLTTTPAPLQIPPEPLSPPRAQRQGRRKGPGAR